MLINKQFSSFPLSRSRRLRSSSWIREICSENNLRLENLVLPIFLREDDDNEFSIKKMPDIKRFSINNLEKEINEITQLGIKTIALFPKIKRSQRSNNAKEAYNSNNLVCRALKKIQKLNPDLLIICDIALDPYTVSGHDGVLDNEGQIDNDKTLKILSKMAITLCKAGCKIISPSDMMDGRVQHIRSQLEMNNFHNIVLLSYSAKFCSQLYGPFREALGNNKIISKNTYQINPKNRLEAIKDSMMDIKEGADIIMVKPASFYLDIIRELKDNTYLPVAAFQVSGEYSMIKLASEKQIFDYKEIVLESLHCIKRAGADIIFSYFSKDVAKWIKQTK